VQDSADSSIPGNWSEPNYADGWTTVPKSHHTRRREEQDILKQLQDDSDIWQDDPLFDKHMSEKKIDALHESNKTRWTPESNKPHWTPESNKPHWTPGSVASRANTPHMHPDARDTSRVNTPHIHPDTRDTSRVNTLDPDEQSREQSQRLRELLAQRDADKHPTEYIDKSPSAAKLRHDQYKIEARNDLDDMAVDNERETRNLVALGVMLNKFYKIYGDACVVPCAFKVKERLSALRTEMENADEMSYIEGQVDKDEKEHEADMERISEEYAGRKDRMRYDDDVADRQHEKFDRQTRKVPQYRPRM
jgi:hypothetical protein